MLIKREPTKEGMGLHVTRGFAVRHASHGPTRVDLRQYTSRFTAKDGAMSFYSSLTTNVRWMAGRFLGRLRHAVSPSDRPPGMHS